MHSIYSNWVEAMATDDKEFFAALGLCTAQLRKDRGWTQQEHFAKRGSMPKWQQQMAAITPLPKAQRQWSAPAIARTTPAILGRYSIITLAANAWLAEQTMPARHAA